MLNGIAPVLIFYFPQKIITESVTGVVNGLPVITTTEEENLGLPFGLPLPIYLDERITGVYISGESKNLDIETDVQLAANATKKAVIAQRGLGSVVNIDLFGKKDSVILLALLAFNDLIFQKVVSKEYSISYMNGPTILFNGLLHSFSSNLTSEDDLLRINIQISKANAKSTRPNTVDPSVSNTPGTRLGPTVST